MSFADGPDCGNGNDNLAPRTVPTGVTISKGAGSSCRMTESFFKGEQHSDWWWRWRLPLLWLWLWLWLFEQNCRLGGSNTASSSVAFRDGIGMGERLLLHPRPPASVSMMSVSESAEAAEAAAAREKTSELLSLSLLLLLLLFLLAEAMARCEAVVSCPRAGPALLSGAFMRMVVGVASDDSVMVHAPVSFGFAVFSTPTH
jgi:hypothetical protein